MNIYNANQKSILSEDNFNKKFSNNLFRLENLNYNSKCYYKYKENTFLELNDYNEAVSNFYFLMIHQYQGYFIYMVQKDVQKQPFCNI